MKEELTKFAKDKLEILINYNQQIDDLEGFQSFNTFHLRELKNVLEEVLKE